MQSRRLKKMEVIGHDGIHYVPPSTIKYTSKKRLRSSSSSNDIEDVKVPTPKNIRPCRSFQDLEHEYNVFR